MPSGRLVVLLLLVIGFAVPARPQTHADCRVAGALEVIPFHSKVFQNTRRLRVWLPPGYANHPTAKYPVLYLNDGQNLFDACTSLFNGLEWQADESAEALIRGGKIEPLIIVGIDNAGRRDRAREYLPYPDETLTPAVPVVEGKKYPQFLIDEVMPAINRRYRTLRGAESTGLGGSSYGAGIALYTVMARPGIFGRLLLESPSLYAHDNFLLNMAKGVRRWPQRIYLGVGTRQEPVQDTQYLHSILSRDGLGADRLKLVQSEGAHDEKAWADRFPSALKFLFPAAASPSP